MRIKRQPVALTIAGSDSGGGAGLQADLKTFAALGVHGTTVVTAITAQNPAAVLAIEPCSLEIIRDQWRAVAELRPQAAKSGMLHSGEVICEIAALFRRNPCCPLVVDPVMVATSGTPLLERSAVAALKEKLFPLATLITPNVAEAEALLDAPLTDPEHLRAAARELHARYRCAVLVKGGHLATGRRAIDIFFDGRTELLLDGPRATNVTTHGTGCTYAAAIVAHLAHGRRLATAVSRAKDYVTRAIHGSVRVGPRFRALDHFA